MTKTSTCRFMFLTRHLLGDTADAHPCDSAAASCSFMWRGGYFYLRRTESFFLSQSPLRPQQSNVHPSVWKPPPSCILRKWKNPAPSHVCVSVSQPSDSHLPDSVRIGPPLQAGSGSHGRSAVTGCCPVDSQPQLVLSYPPTMCFLSFILFTDTEIINK